MQPQVRRMPKLRTGVCVWALLSVIILFAIAGYLIAMFYTAHRVDLAYPVIVAPGADDRHRIEAYKRFNPSIELPTWMESPLPLAYMSMENSVHFSLRALAEWDNGTLPGSNHDGIFWLRVDNGREKRAFTTSMFHQIRCLNIIRSSAVEFRSRGVPPNALTQHCMNYIRQMVLCRSDITMESGRDPVGPQAVVSDITHVCRDWSVVWKDVESRIVD